MRRRVERSIRILEAVTERFHKYYPGGAKGPTSLGKLPLGPVSNIPDLAAHDELSVALRLRGDSIKQVTKDAVEAEIDE
eukprot:13207647-Alexandrium_andersonii.AAC.1